MKKILQAIQTALEKVEQIGERKRALETEQRELQPKLETLMAAVAGGDSKSVNALTIAKARAELLPKDFIAIQTDYDDAIGELRSLILEIPTMLHEAYSAECQRVESLAQKFLESHLDNNYLIGEITRQIVTNSPKIRSLDMLKTVLSDSSIHIPNPSQILAKARYAVENLANI
jgi:seryl-tRNA synthetase